MQNVSDSASRHRLLHDKTAIPPRYASGDKVLLYDSKVKRGETGKLKPEYAGPFIITECKPCFNYRLQHLASGNDL